MGEAHRYALGGMIEIFHRPLRALLVMTALLAAVGLMTPLTAHAQEARESVTMSPTSSQYSIKAGSSVSDELTIVNDGETAYDFLVYARPYSIVNNQYDNPNFTTPNTAADLYGWVSFPKTSYHIDAGATVKVKYSINVPKGAAPGGHYGVIFVEVQPKAQATAGNSITRKKRIGSIIYATVKGEVKLAGDMAAGGIPFWQVEPPLKATVAAKNTGNTHFTDTVRMTVRDVFGNVKYNAAKDYQVLPGTTRTINMEWSQAPWFGYYRVETEQKFLDKTYTSTGYVLIMPRYMPFALIVILVIGGVYAIIRRKKK